MTSYAILCGSAPDNYRQKKMIDMYKLLTISEKFPVPSCNIITFPNGVNEMLLEGVLNKTFDEISNTDNDIEHSSDRIILFLCTNSESDLNAELEDSFTPNINVIRLNNEEIRKDVIAYYKTIAEKYEIDMQVIYDWDNEFLSDESLGYEKVS